MKLFAKYPWLESIGLSDDGEPLVNGFRRSDVEYESLVRWADHADSAFADVRKELGGNPPLDFAIWRHEMAVAA